MWCHFSAVANTIAPDGAARVLQPGHGRADRHGRDHQARRGSGGRRRRRRGPAILGAADAGRPGPLPAQGRGRARRGGRRGRGASHPRAGQADHRELHDGGRPDHRRPPLVRQRGPEDPRRRADPDGPGAVPHQAGEVQLPADGRGRRDRALELPLVDPVRRGRDGADGGQRRGAQARQPHAAARRADPRDLREGGPSRGPRARGPRRRRDRLGPVRVDGAEDLLHRLGRGRPQGRRALRRSGSRARCSSSAARTRRSSARTPTSPNAISGCVWGGFANAGQTCSGIERTYVVKEVADRFIEGVTRRASELSVGDPMEWETEIGPMVSEDQYGLVNELVDDALVKRRRAGGRRAARGPRLHAASSSRRRSSRASRTRCGS